MSKILFMIKKTSSLKKKSNLKRKKCRKLHAIILKTNKEKSNQSIKN